MTPLGLRKRWRGMMRRRLMGLRGRIDRRIERLDEKRQRLDVKVAKTGHAYWQAGLRNPSRAIAGRWGNDTLLGAAPQGAGGTLAGIRRSQ